MGVEDSLRGFAGEYGVALPDAIFYKGKKAFLVSERVQELVERIGVEPFSMGLPLGEETSKGFKPSFALLDLLKKSGNRVVIGDDAEFLFTCGRDVFPEKVLYEGDLKKVFLVTNKRGDVLGLASKGKKGVVNNVYDRGDFLRREGQRKT